MVRALDLYQAMEKESPSKTRSVQIYPFPRPFQHNRNLSNDFESLLLYTEYTIWAKCRFSEGYVSKQLNMCRVSKQKNFARKYKEIQKVALGF